MADINEVGELIYAVMADPDAIVWATRDEVRFKHFTVSSTTFTMAQCLGFLLPIKGNVASGYKVSYAHKYALNKLMRIVAEDKSNLWIKYHTYAEKTSHAPED